MVKSIPMPYVAKPIKIPPQIMAAHTIIAGMLDFTALKLVKTAVIISTRRSIMSGIEKAEMLNTTQAKTKPTSEPITKKGKNSVSGAPCTEGYRAWSRAAIRIQKIIHTASITANAH